ncbi:MAG: hypothetical protein PWQ44_2364 [Methanolobus sp.]|nr:hypothetical protein [Methanolobus sp.]
MLSRLLNVLFKNIVPKIGKHTQSFIEDHKGIRRIILLIVLWINVHIFIISVNMYKSTLGLDQQWVIFAGYWAGIFATIVGFYTSGRTKEQVAKINKIKEIDEKTVEPWKFKSDQKLEIYDEDDTDNIEESNDQ